MDRVQASRLADKYCTRNGKPLSPSKSAAMQRPEERRAIDPPRKDDQAKRELERMERKLEHIRRAFENHGPTLRQLVRMTRNSAASTALDAIERAMQ